MAKTDGTGRRGEKKRRKGRKKERGPSERNGKEGIGVDGEEMRGADAGGRKRER